MKSLKLLSNVLGVALAILIIRGLWSHDLTGGFLFWYLLVSISARLLLMALAVVLVVLEEARGAEHTHVGSCVSCGKRWK